MRTKELGNTGVEIPEIGLGTSPVQRRLRAPGARY